MINPLLHLALKLKQTRNSFDISGITDKSIDLYVWVETKDGFVGAAEKQTVNVKQAGDQKPAPKVEKSVQKVKLQQLQK